MLDHGGAKETQSCAGAKGWVDMESGGPWCSQGAAYQSQDGGKKV